MSLRREKKPVAAPKAVGAAPGLHNLSRVLEIGAANKATIDAGLTDVEFAAEVDRLVEFEKAKMPSMSREDYERYKKMAADKTREYTMKAKDAAMRGSKEAARLTKEGAKIVLLEVKKMWENAKGHIHFATTSNYELKKRLKADYRKFFVKAAWEKLQLSKKGSKEYHNDTGGNLFCDVTFYGTTVEVKVYVYFKEDDPEYSQFAKLDAAMEHTEKRDLGDGMDAITYSGICGFVDNMIDICVDTVMAPFGKKK